MWPSFAGISGSKTKSITVARPRTSGGFAAPVALSGRRGLTGSIGSGRRTAIGPWTPQCRRCSRTRSRAGGAMSRAKRWFISMPIFHPWLARRNSEIPRTEGGRRGREEWSPSWGLGEAGERREAMGVWESETFRKLLWVRELLTGNSRGVLCRTCVCDEARSAERWQPGRERPPLPPPGPGPGPVGRGSLTPRLRVSFVRTNVTAHSSSTRHSAWSRSGTPARRAQRREMGAHRYNFFPTGGCYAIDQAAHARQAAGETSHTTRLREQRDAVRVRAVPRRVDRVRAQSGNRHRARSRQGVREVAGDASRLVCASDARPAPPEERWTTPRRLKCRRDRRSSHRR